MKRNAAEFMQYRKPLGAGPSSKTCPRWESACADRTSVRAMKSERSVRVWMFAGSSGFVKLGHPVPDSNLSSEEKSGSPDTTATESPGRWLAQYSVWNGGSVASRRVT